MGKTALRYARLTGSRKTFQRNEYLKRIRKLMTKHLNMLKGKNYLDSLGKEENLEEEIMDLDDLEVDEEQKDDEEQQKNPKQKKKKTKLKCIKKYKLRYSYS